MNALIWDLQKYILLKKISYANNNGDFTAFFVMNDTNLLIGSRSLIIYSLQNYSMIKNTNFDGQFLCMCLLSNDFFLAGNDKGDILVFNTNNWTKKAEFIAHNYKIYAIEQITEGIFVTGGDDNLLKYWNVKTFTLNKSFNIGRRTFNIRSLNKLGILENEPFELTIIKQDLTTGYSKINKETTQKTSELTSAKDLTSESLRLIELETTILTTETFNQTSSNIQNTNKILWDMRLEYPNIVAFRKTNLTTNPRPSSLFTLINQHDQSLNYQLVLEFREMRRLSCLKICMNHGNCKIVLFYRVSFLCQFYS